jgi:hypothetical protein
MLSIRLQVEKHRQGSIIRSREGGSKQAKAAAEETMRDDKWQDMYRADEV